MVGERKTNAGLVRIRAKNREGHLKYPKTTKYEKCLRSASGCGENLAKPLQNDPIGPSGNGVVTTPVKGVAP
jgi:hypothetical protein